jgi:hypothetical protein
MDSAISSLWIIILIDKYSKSKIKNLEYSINKNINFKNFYILDNYSNELGNLSKIYNNYIEPQFKSDQRIVSKHFKYFSNTQNFSSLNLSLDIKSIFCTTINTKYNIKSNNSYVNSFFIHVTYLSNFTQFQKYQTILEFLKFPNII